jgi:galactokinase
VKAQAGLNELLDARSRSTRIAETGLTGDAAARADHLLQRCADALISAGASIDMTASAFGVPGRIEVLGKHTDYAGGRSLLAAAERGFVTVVASRADDEVHLFDVRSGESTSFILEPDLESGIEWRQYPMTAARRIARNFEGARRGADIAVVSDLPQAAGMSSSSAFIVSTFLALAAANELANDERYRQLIASPEDLAGYLAAVENGQDFRSLAGDRGVGTQGGSEDHTAMLCARAGQLVQYAFAPVRFERSISIPSSHLFVIAASGVRAEKTVAARDRYNRAAMLMRSAAEQWRAATGDDAATIGAVIERGHAASEVRHVLARALADDTSATDLLRRVDHFMVESQEIIPAAGDALQQGDLATFGTLTDRSQRESERLLGNQTDETVHLASSARVLGAAAATAFGAGFGGSVWALVDRAQVDHFEREWRATYLSRFPEHEADAQFFQTEAGRPMIRFL